MFTPNSRKNATDRINASGLSSASISRVDSSFTRDSDDESARSVYWPIVYNPLSHGLPPAGAAFTADRLSEHPSFKLEQKTYNSPVNELGNQSKTGSTWRDSMDMPVAGGLPYILPDTDLGRKVTKKLESKLGRKQHKKRDSNMHNTSLAELYNIDAPATGKIHFVSDALKSVTANSAKLQREYLFPRATTQISYSDERIRMRLTNKANDVRNARPIMYANCDEVGMRSSSALAILNPFKEPLESLIHPQDEQALRPLKKAARQSSNVRKHQFKSYLAESAMFLRNAASEQGFYLNSKRSIDQIVKFRQASKKTETTESEESSSTSISIDDIDRLRKINEEMLYRLKYSNFILKIIDTMEDNNEEITKSMAMFLQHQTANQSPNAQSPRFVTDGSSITAHHLTDEGIKYTVTYDNDVTKPVIVKIIADHSMLELLFATYKEKKDLIRIIKDYEQEQIAFRMGLLQAKISSALTKMVGPTMEKDRQDRTLRSMSATTAREKQQLTSISRFSRMSGSILSGRLSISLLQDQQSVDVQKQDTRDTRIYALNEHLRELEQKRRNRTLDPQAMPQRDVPPTTFNLSLSSQSPVSVSPQSILDNVHALYDGIDFTFQDPVPISGNSVDVNQRTERLTEKSTHTLALSLLDTFSIRQSMCKTVLLEQSRRNPDDLLARVSQLQEKLSEKREIENYTAEQMKRTSVNVQKSNREVISYMVSSHHESRRILSEEDFRLTMDKLDKPVVARDYFNGQAPDGANKVKIDNKSVTEILRSYAHEPLGGAKDAETEKKKISTYQRSCRRTMKARTPGESEPPLPTNLNFKTHVITHPAGPWKSSKITLPDFCS